MVGGADDAGATGPGVRGLPSPTPVDEEDEEDEEDEGEENLLEEGELGELLGEVLEGHLEGHLEGGEAVMTHACSHPGCDARFRLRSNLTRHNRVHTGEKPVSLALEWGAYPFHAFPSTFLPFWVTSLLPRPRASSLARSLARPSLAIRSLHVGRTTPSPPPSPPRARTQCATQTR